MNLLDLISGGGSREDEGLLKQAHAMAIEEEGLRKVANHNLAYGQFMGKGFVAGMMDKLAEVAQAVGVDNVNPPSAAQSPPKGGIELPSDAPGPNDSLKTTRPGGGEQHNNEMFTKKIEEKRLQAGLQDLQGNGIFTLSGSDHGTTAQFAVDHNQGGTKG